MSDRPDKTLKERAKDLASEYQSAMVLLERAAVDKERAEVAYAQRKARVEELIWQTERLGDEHDF